jgi:hypothetical protein
MSLLVVVVIVIVILFLLCEKRNENFKAFTMSGRWIKNMTVDNLIDQPPTPEVINEPNFIKKTNDGKGYYFSVYHLPASIIKLGDEGNKINFFRNSIMPPADQKFYDANQLMVFGNLDGNVKMSQLLQRTDSNYINCDRQTFGIDKNDNQFAKQKNSCYFISK